MTRVIFSSLFVFLIFNFKSNCYVTDRYDATTKMPVNATNAPKTNSSISLKVLSNPHHLYIGRCGPLDQVLHQENIILNNDGKSQVNATIRINVEGHVFITCAKVLDQVSDGEGAYPTFVEGGVASNYVVFNVTAAYGKGFNFYVQINGYFFEDGDDYEEYV